MMKNLKSDIGAKGAFRRELLSRGFEARIAKSPADIVATKDGRTWYFEIKMTRRTDTYFGAATLTEWAQALADPDHFRFVVAICKDDDGTSFEFREYTPAEFMEFSTVPPFKVFFKMDLTGRKPDKAGRTTSVRLTEDGFARLKDCYDGLKAATTGPSL